MPTCYRVGVPSPGEGAKVLELDCSNRIGENDRLEVDGLSGCMGTVCVSFEPAGDEVKPRHALLIHDPVSGYPDTKDKLDDFFKAAKNRGCKFAIAYKAKEGVGQNTWLLDKTEWRYGDFRNNFGNVCCAPKIHKRGGLFNGRVLNFDLMPGDYADSETMLVVRETDMTCLQRPSNLTLMPKSQWQKDGLHRTCQRCNGPFIKNYFFSGKHHCRNCGYCICQTCSTFAVGHEPARTTRFCTFCLPPKSWST